MLIVILLYQQLQVRYVENSLNKAHPTQPQPGPNFQVGVRAADGPLIEAVSEKTETTNFDDKTPIRVHSLTRGVARFHLLVFTSDALASPTRALAAKTLAENVDHHLSKWRAKWIFSTKVRDGFEDQHLFKAHVIAGSISSDASGLESMLIKPIGDGKVYVDNTKVVHERYGCPWSRGQGGIVVLRPDSHIGYRVDGFGDQAWRDVDHYLRSILA